MGPPVEAAGGGIEALDGAEAPGASLAGEELAGPEESGTALEGEEHELFFFFFSFRTGGT